MAIVQLTEFLNSEQGISSPVSETERTEATELPTTTSRPELSVDQTRDPASTT